MYSRLVNTLSSAQSARRVWNTFLTKNGSIGMKRIIHYRRLIVFFNDISMVVLAWIAASSLYYDFKLPSFIISHCLPFILLIQAGVFYFCGLYRGIWRFASIPDLMRILQAVLIGVLSIILLFQIEDLPLLMMQIPTLYGILLLLFLSGPRILYRWFKDYTPSLLGCERLLIIGAGSAGESLVRDLRRLRLQGYRPVAFVDDDKKKIGRELHGIRIKASCDAIPKIVKDLDIQLCIVAMPSATSAQMRRIVSLCEETNVRFCTMPSLRELAEGRINVNELREVSLQDLLGREEVDLNEESIRLFILNKVIAISGGGGSIGSELCMQLASLKPQKLIVIDNSEFNLYTIDMKLRNQYPQLNLLTVLCSTTDRIAVDRIFVNDKPEICFHAAAFKHVPLLESQLRVAIYNNIIGTRVFAETAVKHGCGIFVLISTDKAVNPTNVMGATKRASEIFCQNYNSLNQTRFITVRFGNVLDSAGSVIPLFRKQLKAGGPLTVTHPEITRYFMTIPEASQLIIQAASLGKGGEIFILDMGEAIKIRYLAEKLISFSGKVLGRDIDIEYTGLRAGEKLHEELFYEEEALSFTTHPKIRKAKSQKYSWLLLIKVLNEIEQAYETHNEEKLLDLLQLLVPEYQSNLANNQQKQEIKLNLYKN